MRRIKAWFTNNLGLKLFSIAFAIILWLLVTNYNDPSTSIQISNVPVTFINAETLEDQGETYIVEDGTDTIPVVSITAKRSIVDSLSADNVVAEADLSKISDDGTVRIQLSTNKYADSISSITGSINEVKVSVEKEESKSLPITAKTSGSPAQGYTVGTVTTSQNQVKITGAASIVDTVETAETTVDVSGYSSAISTKASLDLYDSDGNVVDQTNLTLNIDSVNVAVEILPTKTVSITAQTQGDPADGYILENISIDPDEVVIAGRNSILKGTESIVIPAEEVDITDARKDVTAKVDLTDYLPDGIILANSDSDSDINVTVTAHITRGEEKTVDFETGDISLTNVPDGYTAEVTGTSQDSGDSEDEDTLSLTVEGTTSMLTSVTSSTIAPTIDVSALTENTNADTGDLSGDYDAQVTFTLPDGVRMEDNVVVTVTLTAD